MSGHITYPEVRTSRTFPTEQSIQKHVGTTHGLTLIVLSLIDKANAELSMDLSCVGESQLQDFSTQIMGILQHSEVIKVYFRSVRVNGVYQDTYDEFKLERDSSRPTNPEQFKNKSHAICDIEITGDGQKWSFWRTPEATPRVLNLLVK